MIIAIDESGSFAENQATPSFFIAIHLHGTQEELRGKEASFYNWEKSVPASLKAKSGEVKGHRLGLAQYIDFIENILLTKPYIGITSVAIYPIKNPKRILENRKLFTLAGINDAVLQAAKHKRVGQQRTYYELANHYRRLNYSILLKYELLGNCIMHSFVNSIGHAFCEGFDNELLDLEIKIDKDFITSSKRKIFWREILRNQMRVLSVTDPIVLPEDLKQTGHPFIEKYKRNGQLDFRELFVNHCNFVNSRCEFGVRIADVVASIFYKSSRNVGIRLPKPMLSCLWNPDGVHLIEIQLDNLDIRDFLS